MALVGLTRDSCHSLADSVTDTHQPGMKSRTALRWWSRPAHARCLPLLARVNPASPLTHHASLHAYTLLSLPPNLLPDNLKSFIPEEGASIDHLSAKPVITCKPFFMSLQRMTLPPRTYSTSQSLVFNFLLPVYRMCTV